VTGILGSHRYIDRPARNGREIMSTTTIIGLVAFFLLFGRTLLRFVKAVVALGLIIAVVAVIWIFGLLTVPLS